MKFDQVRCCLSGLLIKRQKDLTVEHYVPKARTSSLFSEAPYNIKPAIKIINCIKGTLLPCEWVVLREQKLLEALERWNLTGNDRAIIIQALDRLATEKGSLNPCQDCILSAAKEHCYDARNMEGYRISRLPSVKSR